EAGSGNSDEDAGPGFRRGTGISHGHEPRGQLVRGHHDPEAAATQGFEHGDHLRPRQSEDAIHPQGFETLDEEIGTGAGAHEVPLPVKRRASDARCARAAHPAFARAVPARKLVATRLWSTSVSSSDPPNWLLKCVTGLRDASVRSLARNPSLASA